MWVFNRTEGKLISPRGEQFPAYSGHGEGVNNPSLQSVHDVGPIPAGLWDIGTPRDTTTHGPFVLPLTPQAATDVYGRSGFLIHGDSAEHPGQASLGCVITSHDVRHLIYNSRDFVLQVV